MQFDAVSVDKESLLLASGYQSVIYLLILAPSKLNVYD